MGRTLSNGRRSPDQADMTVARNETSQGYPNEMRVPRVMFVGEQDGPVEREFKQRLVEHFGHDRRVGAAYLARVAYSDATPVLVALCLRAEPGQERDLAENAAQIFSSMFGRHEHLDILFLDAQQETELSKVCPAFIP